MKFLYKYPQAEFPYAKLVEENRIRGGHGPEFELLDSGVFDHDRYFDVFVEYAKASEEDICIRIEAFNRGPEAATLHIIPHLWFRNTWGGTETADPEPVIRVGPSGEKFICVTADDSTGAMLKNIPFKYNLGQRNLYADA